MRTPFLADPVFKTQQLFGLPVGRVRRPTLRDGLHDPYTIGLPHPVVPFMVTPIILGHEVTQRKSVWFSPNLLENLQARRLSIGSFSVHGLHGLTDEHG